VFRLIRNRYALCFAFVFVFGCFTNPLRKTNYPKGKQTEKHSTKTAKILDYSSVADPDPGSGMGKKSGSGSGMNNPDHISESLETIFWVRILKFFDADPGWKKFGSGMEKIRILDLG
jgi:hypothetical protein